MGSLQPLRIATVAELVTLAVLLGNLATAHWPAVSSLVGPTHGCAYLFVVIAAARAPGARRQTTLLALLPGAGGLLALRQLTSTQRCTSPLAPMAPELTE